MKISEHTKLLQELCISLIWLRSVGWEDKGYHAEPDNNCKNIVICHDKTPEFEYIIDLNDCKSIKEGINIIQCWANKAFEPADELKYGC